MTTDWFDLFRDASAIVNFFLEPNSASLLFEELVSGAVSELDQATDPLPFCFFSVVLFKLLDKFVLMLQVVVVVGVVKLVHVVGCAVWVVPNELLGAVEIFVFDEWLLDRICRVWQHRLEVMPFDSAILKLFHKVNK